MFSSICCPTDDASWLRFECGHFWDQHQHFEAGNFEIFRWRRGASPVRSLAQLTETAAGHSVLPRPTRTPRRFVFYSTVMPAVGEPRLERGTVQCGPVALIWANRRVRLVHGVLDSENAKLIAFSTLKRIGVDEATAHIEAWLDDVRK